MTKIKILTMFVLTIVLCIMTLGYAALQEKIDITGGASINSVYRVEITKIEQASLTGSAEVKEIPTYTGLTANFHVGLTAVTDTITYNVEISNLGTVDVKLNNTIINVEGSNKIKVTKSGVANGDIILAGESKVMIVKIKYDGEEEANEITGTISMNLDYTRLKGGVGEVVEEELAYEYEIGDQISFAGSNWYVVKNSSYEEDYVMLMKEALLTNEELGDYAKSSTSNTMAYYWSDTCHYGGAYGYASNDTSGCSGHNDYEGSKVKEMLDNQYLPILGEENLKEVDGYKIRLITRDELKKNLGCNTDSSTCTNDGVPTWVYQTPDQKGYLIIPKVNGTNANSVTYNGAVGSNIVCYHALGVRPVINLLKSSI